MSEHFARWLRRSRRRPPPEALSANKIETGYRLFWTKAALAWDASHRADISARVTTLIASPGFEANALERRFRVEGLDEHAHSGASLMALLEVLRALGDDDEVA